METYAARLQWAMERAGKTNQSSLAREIDIAPQSIQYLANPKNNAQGSVYTAALALALDVSADWLASGIGGPERRSERDEPEDERGTVLPYDRADELPPDAGRVWVDRVDYVVSAGGGAAVQWEVREKARLPFSMSFFQQKRADPRNCKLIMVRGRSMEPYLFDHDLAMVDTADTRPTDGEVYAVYYDDESFVKQVFRLPGGGLRLHSYNASFPDLEIVGAQLELVRIVGRVIYRSG